MSSNLHAPEPADAEPIVAEVVDAAPAKRNRNPFVFALKAIEIRLRFIIVLVAVAVVVGQWDWIKNTIDKWTRPSEGAELDGGIEFYCPMEPHVVRHEYDPGGRVPKCPICRMDLVLRKKGEPVHLPDGVLARVQVSPRRIQFAGIATAEIAHRPLVRELRTVGFVDFDESRLYRIVPRVEGYVEKLHVNKTFVEVAAGEPLAEVYSPQLYTAVQELLIARRSGSENLVALGREKLRLLGIDEREIDDIAAGQKADYRLVLRSPANGHVVRKEVIEGDRIEAGRMLLEVADLSTVWIEADVFERDISLIEPNQTIEAVVEAYPDRTFRGRVTLVHPHLNMTTRTNRVRFELENSEHLLRPGMYATVRLQTPVISTQPFQSQLAASREEPPQDQKQLIEHQRYCPVMRLRLGSMGEPVSVDWEGGTTLLCCNACIDRFQARPVHYAQRLRRVLDDAVLAVPVDAVIDTGTQKVVYVESAPGVFDAVEVRLGPRAGQYYAVVDGLLAGDRVVSSGAFLVDAETRLTNLAGTFFGAGAAGAAATPSGSSVIVQQPQAPGGTDARKKPTPEDLANVAKLPPEDREQAQWQIVCPVTSEPLGSMGVPVKIMLGEQPVLLCCKGCEDRARRNADRIVRQLAEWKQMKQ